jgi:hypothetical protein
MDMPIKIPDRLQKYCTQYAWESILKPKLAELGLKFDYIYIIYEVIPLRVYTAYVKVKCTNYLDPLAWKCNYVNIRVRIPEGSSLKYSIYKVDFDSDIESKMPLKILYDGRSKN